MSATYGVPNLEHCIIIAVIHNDGTMHSIGVINLEEFDNAAAVEIFAGRSLDSEEFAIRVVAVADADHAAQGVFALDAITGAAERAGISLLNVIMTPKIAAGQHWTDLRTQEYGILPDPAMTAPAIAAIVDGFGPLPDAEEITRLFTEITPADTDHARTTQRDNPRFGRDTLHEVRKTIVEYLRTYDPDWADGGVIGADFAADERTRLLDNTAEGLAARIGVLVEVSGSARDALLGLAVIDIPTAARIYTHIANQLEGIHRAHMLAVAAVLYHVDGRPFHARDALYRCGLAVLGESGHLSETMPVIGRALLAAARANVETDTARRFLALGPIAARRFGIETPDYDLYPAE
ncbi:DUF4192 family protein [Nocardia sp. CA-120079]|uniref:DUF4192 family protein n=1 Tax=Nocardia sp. CA-120079 TaxID=3239974 RepID=UPI003D97960C